MNNIKILRTEKNLTQSELGKIVHVAQTAVSQWELGVKNPEQETAVALADYFGVSLDFLLGRTTDRTNSYVANNISGSNLVQGNGFVNIGEDKCASKEETELFRIFQKLDVRRRLKLLSFAIELEDEGNNGDI